MRRGGLGAVGSSKGDRGGVNGLCVVVGEEQWRQRRRKREGEGEQGRNRKGREGEVTAVEV